VHVSLNANEPQLRPLIQKRAEHLQIMPRIPWQKLKLCLFLTIISIAVTLIWHCSCSSS